jgi:hypothetical protein
MAEETKRIGRKTKKSAGQWQVAFLRAAVPKEQSGGGGSVQRELCVFVPDACNTFPLPIGDLPVCRWLKIRVVIARRLRGRFNPTPPC